MKNVARALAFLASICAASAQAVVINIDSTSSTGVTLSLAPGDYTIEYANGASGALYPAFSFWSDVTGCNARGTNCTHGWADTFWISTGADVHVFGVANGPFATPSEALAATLAGPLYTRLNGGPASVVGEPIPFHLDALSNVKFFIDDTVYSDNFGGVSLILSSQVNAVPEPETYALMLAGLAALGVASRRRSRGA